MVADIQSLWDFDDPAGSEQRFREALAASPADGPEIQTQIARALGLQGKFDAAHQTLDAVMPNSPRVEVRSLLERGRVYNSSGKPDQARPLFMTAWEKARAGQLDFFAVDAAHMLGILDGMEWHEKALALAETSPDPTAQGWIGSLLNNIGWTYYEQGEYALALDAFERDLKWFEERQLNERARIARYSIGKTYRAMGRIKEALAIQQEILQAQPDDQYVREEIAECLKQLAQEEPAHDRK